MFENYTFKKLLRKQEQNLKNLRKQWVIEQKFYKIKRI